MPIEQYMKVAKHYNDSYKESSDALEGFKKDNFIVEEHTPEKSFYSVLLIPSARQNGKEVKGYADYDFDNTVIFISQFIEQFGNKTFTIELTSQISKNEKETLEEILGLAKLSFAGTDICPEIKCNYASEKITN